MRRETERQGENKIKNHSWKERDRESQTDRQGRTEKKRETEIDRRTFGTGRLQTRGWASTLRTQKPGA